MGNSSSLLTTQDVAEQLQCSVEAAQRIIRLGYLKSSRLPGLGIRVRPEDLQDYINNYSTQSKRKKGK